MSKLIEKIKGEISYFWWKNEEDIWAVLFLIWLGIMINAK